MYEVRGKRRRAGPSSPPRAYSFYFLCGLAVIGIMMSACKDDRSGFAQLARVESINSPVFGRLRAELPPSRIFGGDCTDRRSLVRNLPKWNPTSSTQRALGSLLAGDPTAAIRLLGAGSEPSDSSDDLSDLAAAYLTRYRLEDRPIDLLRARRTAIAALRIDRGHAAASFNLALSLTELGLYREASETWDRFITLQGDDFTDCWNLIARRYKVQVSPPSPRDLWLRVRERLLDVSLAVSDEDLQAIVRKYPLHVRLFAQEEMFLEWSQALSTGQADRAHRRLEMIGRIAHNLEHMHGEGLLADALSALRSALSAGHPSAELAEGHLAFGLGAEAYHRQAFTDASTHLVRAEERLKSIDSPLSLWAAFYLAISEYYRSVDEGRRRLEVLRQRVDPERYAGLAGRVHWMLGTIDKVQGRLESSLEQSRQARRLLERSSGQAGASFVEVLLAESYSMLGDHEVGWAHRWKAFRSVPLHEGPRRQIAMWGEALHALRRQGRSELAEPLLDEAVRAAREWGQPLGLVTSYLYRSEVRIADGRLRAAARDLALAEEALGMLEPGDLQEWMTSKAQIIEAQLALSEDPRRAIALLDASLGQGERVGYDWDTLDRLLLRADAHLRLGHLAAARSDYEGLIGRLERLRSQPDEPARRILAFRKVQRAFDGLLTTLHKSGVAMEYLFTQADRGRARTLLDLRGGAKVREAWKGLSPAALQAALPEGTALIQFSVLPETVLAWRVERGGMWGLALMAPPIELERMARQYQVALETGAPLAELRRLSQELHQSLVAPLSLPRSRSSLIVVADRFLGDVAYESLLNPATDQYLIEQSPIVLAPSASFVFNLLSSQDPAAPSGRSLVIGLRGAAVYGTRRMAELPRAESEAMAVAGFLPGVELVLDGQSAATALRSEEPLELLHFAGHAMSNADDPLRSALVLPIDGRKEAETLSLRDLLALEALGPRLVTLSACSTIDGAPTDRETFLGLASAFLAKGGRHVVGTRWDLQDDTAADFMPRFYAAMQAGHRPPEALREAILDQITSGDLKRASPAAWAGFAISGVP